MQRPSASRPSWILLGGCVVWATASTVWLAASRTEIAQLTEEAVVRQAAHEDKVRALTRGLVGVASHQALEQEGLADRLADIVARQVVLENHEAVLTGMIERARAGTLPMPTAPEDNPTRPPGRRGALLGRMNFVALPLRQRFDRIEASLGDVAAAQNQQLNRLGDLARSSIAQVQQVLADLQLALAPPAAAASVRPQDRRPPFEQDLAPIDAAFAEAGRWHSLIEGLPLRAPIEGEMERTSNFGQRKDPFTGVLRLHAGMDFRSAAGTPVHATAAGRVITAGPSGAYGNLVEVDHGHDVITRYGHLAAIDVHVSQTVPAGAVLGQVGSTGRSTGPHLHYETRLTGAALDPARFLAAGRILSRIPDRMAIPVPAQAFAETETAASAD